MDAANLPNGDQPSLTAGSGELVVLNGRQAGARRPLVSPTTFVGRAADCEIRLNVDGVDPRHCLLVQTPSGFHLRDLHSVHGTFVNGSRVQATLLTNGDLVKVGPFQFRFCQSSVDGSDRKGEAPADLRSRGNCTDRQEPRPPGYHSTVDDAREHRMPHAAPETTAEPPSPERIRIDGCGTTE